MTPKCPDCKRDQDDCICASPAGGQGMSKEPTVLVPASTFLRLARLFKELPQEKVDREDWYVVRTLEQRAYRKLNEKKKEDKP